MIIHLIWFGAGLYTLFYWIRLISNINQYEPEEKIKNKLSPVSIVIASRNDLARLKINLPLLLKQNLSNFEVIVVDDDSDDGSYDWLLDMADKDLRIRVICHIKRMEGKKGALDKGIRRAAYSQLLFTDADCEPASQRWIHIMREHLDAADVVLGHGPYFKKKGLLNAFCRYDNILIAIQYMGRALIGRAYMGIGRNMMYRKETFMSVDGFERHKELISGDDDLFIQSLPTPAKVIISLNPDSFMYSEAPATLTSLIKQKSRHQSTGFYYHLKDQLYLISFPLMLSLFYFLSLFIVLDNPMLVGLTLAARWCVLMVLFKRILTRFKEKDLIKYFPLLDLLYLPIYGVIYIYMIINKNRTWS